MTDLTHLDEQGRARMVDVGGKTRTARAARAEGWIQLSPAVLARIEARTLPKGDPFEVVRIAGIQAAKKTSDLIPLCHPLPLTHIDVNVEWAENGARVEAEVRTTAETGVEMEALVAVSAALLALYDMCKAVDKGIEIGPIRLVEKNGGKSGPWKREDAGR